jgi:glycine oxidase
MHDTVVIGGGVIGLTIAYELAGTGRSVTVLDQSEPGREASWAGAGIFPPCYPGDPTAPLARLTGLSHSLWPALSESLRAATGIDNGFRRCGGIEFGISGEFDDEQEAWRRAAACVETLTRQQLTELEPEIGVGIEGAYRLPDLCQVRNPWHLQALIAACQQRGVVIRSGAKVTRWEFSGGRVNEACTDADHFTAESFVLAAGAWSVPLAADLGVDLEVVPIRGQIALLYDPSIRLSHVLESGPRYVVPRGDGHILIGSTEENVGFQKANTPEAIAELIRFGASLVPALGRSTIKQTWSGLRPQARRGLPWIARSPRFENTFIAAGHYRAGLHLSPVTAQIVLALIVGEPIPEWANAFGV